MLSAAAPAVLVLLHTATATAVVTSPPPLLLQQQQRLRIEPWGANSIRVRAVPASRSIDPDAPGALSAVPPPAPPPPASSTRMASASTQGGGGEEEEEEAGPVSSGVLKCTVAADGRLQFFRLDAPAAIPQQNSLLLSENAARTFGHTPYAAVSNLSASFALHPGEKVWGLGQVESDTLDLSGRCLSTTPENGHVLIPLVHLSRGVSMLFNMPSFGQVCVDAHHTKDRRLTWYSRGVLNFDLWVTTGVVGPGAPPQLAQALRSYVEVTGKPTPFPYWTTGFWQSKNRYTSTAQIMSIAKEYQRRDIPLSLMIIDEGAWDLLGNEGWGGCANGSVTASAAPCPCFADAANMTAELTHMGVEVMLSPYMQFAVQQSTHFKSGRAAAAFAVGVPGKPGASEPACYGYSGYNRKNADDLRCLNHNGTASANDPYCGDGCMWDVFEPASGAIMMRNVASIFYRQSGIKYWWLDCDEPCDYTGRVSSGDALMWGRGKWPDIAVGALYPAMLNRAIFKHMTEVEHEPHVVTLARSAWAGSQRFGVAMWSGDTSSTWASLRQQISEGQMASLSGISYWSSDTGGYQGLQVDNSRGWDMDLLTRWMQFSAFSGIMRLHGYRSPAHDPGMCSSDTSYSSGLGLSPTSAANEVYTFTAADHVFNYSRAIIKMVRLRESMRPYVNATFAQYAQHGTPVMRPSERAISFMFVACSD
jgi:alpha-D-xyloside xylohydrolase